MTKNLIIVGNYEAREKLRKNISTCKPTLLVGPNGIGKSSTVRELADFMEYNFRIVYPIDQEDIVKEFGIGPTSASNNDMYVIEADGLNAKKFAILKTYTQNAERPLVIICQNKEKINKKLVKYLDVISFTFPTMEEVEKLLREQYEWDGNILDVYDPDMRIVMSRINAGEKIIKPPETEHITSQDLAVELGFGYVKKKVFDKLKEPLWWVIRWLSFNQRLKFPNNPTILLNNLEKLSVIDEYRFAGVDNYLHYMLMDVKGSPRRAFFKFPIWPKKGNVDVGFDSIDVAPTRPEMVKERFSLNKWL
jgi:hypothetical protein